MRFVPLFIFLITGYCCAGQQAGYRNITLTDSSRLYKPGVGPGNRLHYRPVEIDCWYPCVTAQASPMQYGEFLQLFEQRANRFQDDTVYANLAGEIAQSLSAGLGIADTGRLWSLAMQSYKNNPPLPGRFPLIIYMCSYNGMSFENVRLFEALAQRGYIVATVTSVGRYPGNMTMDPLDLGEQVADGSFTIDFLRKSGVIDTMKIGVIGYSWGGPAALLLAANPMVTAPRLLAANPMAAANPMVAAVLSLDGSEMHYYGSSAEEDSDFNRLRPDLLRSARSSFAYAYLGSDGKQNERPADSIFNIIPALQGSKKYILFPGATHEDFSCLPAMAAMIRKPDSALPPDYLDVALKWFDNYLKGGSNSLPHDSPYPVVSHPMSSASIVTAKVLDAVDKTPLAYVNVGIPGKNVGTVTQTDGCFKLEMDAALINDSLVVSMAGYEKRMIPLKKIPATILLNRRSGALTEAVVTAGIRPAKVYGNKSTSNSVSVGFPSRFLGAEIGVKMSLGKQLRRLKTFRCHVSDARIDSGIFRLNIYRVRNGSPETFLQQNVFIVIRKGPADYAIDLSGMNLVLSGDILVSLELLRGYSSSSNPGAVFFSAAFFNSGTWRRQTSQAEWKKAHGIGVGFNLECR